MRKKFLAGLVVGGLIGSGWVGTSAAAPAPVHHRRATPVAGACARPSDLVGVFLPDAVSDGDPLDVACGAVTDVHHCRGRGYDRTCLAKLDGFNQWVFVAGVDFPGSR